MDYIYKLYMNKHKYIEIYYINKYIKSYKIYKNINIKICINKIIY